MSQKFLNQSCQNYGRSGITLLETAVRVMSVLPPPVAHLYSPAPKTVKKDYVELPANLLTGCLPLIHISTLFLVENESM